MERREDDFERALLRLRVLVDRNAAAVVRNRDRAAVFVQRDDDVRGVAVHRLVDRVVENLPDEVVEAGAADAADIHARPLADRLEPLEDGDVFRCVGRRHSVQVIVYQDVSMRPEGRGGVRHGRRRTREVPRIQYVNVGQALADPHRAHDGTGRDLRPRPRRPAPRPRPLLRTGPQPDAGHLPGQLQLLPRDVHERRRRRRQLVRRLPSRRRQPVDPLLGADEGAHRHHRQRRTRPRRPLAQRPGLVRVPVRHDDGGGQRLHQPRRRREAARLPAQGRLPVGRRFLGFRTPGTTG